MALKTVFAGWGQITLTFIKSTGGTGQPRLKKHCSALNSLVQAGKVRYLGASNVAGYQLQKAIDISRANGWEPFTCLQPLYNLLDRSIEWELLPVCLEEGVGSDSLESAAGGWLSGKYRRGMSAPLAETRISDAEKNSWGERWSNYANERTWGVIDELLAIAKETDKTPAQVALNWVLSRPGVTAPIIGVRTMAHLEDNLGATGWALSAEQMKKLDQASDLPLPYPYDLLRD